jgi:DNA-binding transcriptional MerR regulator
METYSPTQAARELGVSTATVRRFADTFAELLPDYSKIAEGERREFTDADLRHLWAIIQLMNEQPQGTSRQDLLASLQAADAPPLVVPARLPTPAETEIAQQPPEPEPVPPDNYPQLPAQRRGLDSDMTEMVSTLIEAQSTLVGAQSQQLPDLFNRLEHLSSDNRSMRNQIDELQGNRFSVFHATVWFGWGVIVTVAAIAISLWMLSGVTPDWLPFR